MKNLSDLLWRIAGMKAFIIAILLYLAFGAYIMPRGLMHISALSGHEVRVLDLEVTGYTPERAREILSAYTDEARAFAARFELIGDSAYPVVYTFLFLIMMTWLMRALSLYGYRIPYLHLLPLVVMITDYCENTCIIRMLHSYPAIPDRLVHISSVLTMTKWGLLGIEGLIIIVGLGVLGYRRWAVR